METDEEVALSPGDSEPGSVRRMRMNLAASLRRELSQRAGRYALKHGLPHCLSYGGSPTYVLSLTVIQGTATSCPFTYKVIFRNPTGDAVCRKFIRKVGSRCRDTRVESDESRTLVQVPTLC